MSDLIIRNIRSSDAENLAKYGNNRKIWDNMRDYFPNPYKLEDGVAFIKMIEANEPITTFAISYEDELIGVIGYNLQTDIYSDSAEIGYWLAEPFWGRGFTSKAIKLTIEHAFVKMDIKRLYTSVFEHNLASIRVLEKVDFVYEGKGIKAVMKNGKFYNDLRYALLNPEDFPSNSR